MVNGDAVGQVVGPAILTACVLLLLFGGSVVVGTVRLAGTVGRLCAVSTEILGRVGEILAGSTEDRALLTRMLSIMERDREDRLVSTRRHEDTEQWTRAAETLREAARTQGEVLGELQGVLAREAAAR